jgi:hypothetical protein
MSNLSRPKSKSEKEKDPQVQDRLQILLTRMLNEDDNKYCVDCDSKGNWYFQLFMNLVIFRNYNFSVAVKNAKIRIHSNWI